MEENFYHFQLASFTTLEQPLNVDYCAKYIVASSAEEAIRKILDCQDVKPNPIIVLDTIWIDEIYEMRRCPSLQIDEDQHMNLEKFKCGVANAGLPCRLCRGIIGRGCEARIPYFKRKPVVRWVSVQGTPYKIQSRIVRSH